MVRNIASGRMALISRERCRVKIQWAKHYHVGKAICRTLIFRRKLLRRRACVVNKALTSVEMLSAAFQSPAITPMIKPTANGYADIKTRNVEHIYIQCARWDSSRENKRMTPQAHQKPQLAARYGQIDRISARVSSQRQHGNGEIAAPAMLMMV